MGADAPPVNWRRGWALTSRCLLAYSLLLGVTQLLHGGGLVIAPSQLAASTDALPLPTGVKGMLRSAREWVVSFAPLSEMPQAERLQLLVEENEWKNSLVMWAVPEGMRDALPHFVQTWLRCVVLCALVYYTVGGLWCYYAYFVFGDKLFKAGTMPQTSDVLEQVKVSTQSIPLYSLLPAITEWLAETGWTRSYPRVDNMGTPLYLAYFVLYMASVEFGVYWMHRGLHEIKWGYKHLHHIHHKYNKEHTLSPLAGLAFHPLDGVLQAIPYTLTLLFCPMHFLTHEILLFFTGVWTTNIHDCLHGKVWPIMGAGYHTIHHTTYKHNYGHYFVWMDQMYNTMVTPEEYDASMALETQPEEEQTAAGGKAPAPMAVPAGTQLKASQQQTADATAVVQSNYRTAKVAGKAQ